MSSQDQEEEHVKTPREHVEAVISRLKEMEHYSRGNIERLGEDWFLLDDELKFKDQATRFEDILNAQNAVQDLLLPIIEEFEDFCKTLDA